MSAKEKQAVSKDLCRAFLSLETEEECRRFLEDLCTMAELHAMSQRFQVARMLREGMIYNNILEQTGASSATISRVNRSLQYGADGYEVVFKRLDAEDELATATQATTPVSTTPESGVNSEAQVAEISEISPEKLAEIAQNMSRIMGLK